MSEFLEPSEEEEVGYFDRALLPGDEGQPVSAVTATESMCRLPTRMLASMSNSLQNDLISARGSFRDRRYARSRFPRRYLGEGDKVAQIKSCSSGVRLNCVNCS